MPKLVVMKKAEVIRECDLKTSQPTYSIGSERRNDLSIDDRLVSMTHARIERNENRFFIRDMKSAFGTYVNGNKIEDISELNDGDQIQLGEHLIIFDNPLEKVGLSMLHEANGSNENPKSETAEDQVRLDELEEKVRKESLSLLRQDGSAQSETIPYQLVAVYGPYKSRRYQLGSYETKIGREENLNDIVLDKNHRGEPDQSISRRHAMITYRDGAFFVADKRSKTRTYVNRQVVPSDSEVEVFVNDEIEIVSDQQSTIFRLVEDGNIDARPPRKAGVWWVRYQSQFVAGAVVVASILGLFFIASGFQKRSLLTQQPNPFSLELDYWSADKSLNFQRSSSGEESDQPFFKLVPAVADFNGDHIVDIATTNVTRKPMLIDGESRVPRWLIDTMPAAPDFSLVAADINGNNLPDLIYLSDDGRLVAIDGNHGAEVWVSPFFNEALIGPPVVGDFNGDGLNDVAIADVAGAIHLGYNEVLSMQWAQINTGIPVQAAITTADIDGDSAAELLCGSERGIVFIIDGLNRKIRSTIDINEALNQALGTFYEDNQVRLPVGIANFNGDENPDLVISTVQGRILAIDGATRKRLWFDNLAGELSLNTDRVFPFAIGDFDGDSIDDVVAATDNGEIRAYNGGSADQAKLFWQAQQEKPTSVQGLTIVDINKDRCADILFNDDNGFLWVLDGRTGANLNNVNQPSTILASMPLVADLENDGSLDIFSLTQTGIVFQYKSNSRVPKGTIVWGQQFGQSQNSLNQAYHLPKTFMADVSMLFGLLVFVGSGTLTLVLKRRRQA